MSDCKYDDNSGCGFIVFVIIVLLLLALGDMIYKKFNQFEHQLNRIEKRQIWQGQ